MNFDWREYFYYFVSYFVLLICFASATLFLFVYKKEKKLQTVWRPVGFGLLVVAFLLLIVERVLPFMTVPALLVLWMGFYCVYKGVVLEPSLKHLLEVGGKQTKTSKKKVLDSAESKSFLGGVVKLVKIVSGGIWDDLSAIWVKSKKTMVKSQKEVAELVQTSRLKELMSFVLVLALVGLLVVTVLFTGYLPVYLELMSFIYILATIYVQIQRYKYEKTDWLTNKQNLYPLIGYVFLAGRGVLTFYERLPQSSTVEYYAMTQDYGLLWYLNTLMTWLGFLFLGLWIWNFIRVRLLGNLYSVFILVMGVVAVIGATLVSNSINGILQKNTDGLRGEIAQYAMLDEIDSASLVNAKQQTGYEWVVYVGKQPKLATWGQDYKIDVRAEGRLIEQSWNDKQIVNSIISKKDTPYFALIAPMSADKDGASRVLGMYAPTRLIFNRAYPQLLQVFALSAIGVLVIMMIFYVVLWREKK